MKKNFFFSYFSSAYGQFKTKIYALDYVCIAIRKKLCKKPRCGNDVVLNLHNSPAIKLSL